MTTMSILKQFATIALSKKKNELIINKNAEKTAEFVVYGYIRSIKIKNKIIPISIISLC